MIVKKREIVLNKKSIEKLHLYLDKEKVIDASGTRVVEPIASKTKIQTKRLNAKAEGLKQIKIQPILD